MYRNYRFLVLCIAVVCKSMIACWPSGDIYYQDQPQSHGDIYYDDQPVSYYSNNSLSQNEKVKSIKIDRHKDAFIDIRKGVFIDIHSSPIKIITEQSNTKFFEKEILLDEIAMAVVQGNKKEEEKKSLHLNDLNAK